MFNRILRNIWQNNWVKIKKSPKTFSKYEITFCLKIPMYLLRSSFQVVNKTRRDQCCQIGLFPAPRAVFRVCGAGKILDGLGAGWAGWTFFRFLPKNVRYFRLFWWKIGLVLEFRFLELVGLANWAGFRVGGAGSLKNVWQHCWQLLP